MEILWMALTAAVINMIVKGYKYKEAKEDLNRLYQEDLR